MCFTFVSIGIVWDHVTPTVYGMLERTLVRPVIWLELELKQERCLHSELGREGGRGEGGREGGRGWEGGGRGKGGGREKRGEREGGRRGREGGLYIEICIITIIFFLLYSIVQNIHLGYIRNSK